MHFQNSALFAVWLTTLKTYDVSYIFAKYDQFMPNFLPKGYTFFINPSVDIATYFVILSCSSHLKTAFCTVALMTVYTAEYLLVLAGSGTAGVKDKVVRRSRRLKIQHFMIPVNVLTVSPTLLTGNSNCVQNYKRAD